MKNFKKHFSFLLILIFTLGISFAQSTPSSESKKEHNNYTKLNFYETLSPRLVINFGGAAAQLTRIQLQENRSNFVWKDSLVGAFVSVQTINFKLNWFSKLSAYYPLSYTFNDFPQIAKQVILYAFDFEFGPIWQIPFFNFARLNLGAIVDARYQLSDKFHHIDLGAGGLVGLEFPISKGVTILTNGEFIYSYGNLGTNKVIQPYDQVWSYNVHLGVRLSKKAKNDFSYFKPREKKSKFLLSNEEEDKDASNIESKSESLSPEVEI